MPRLIFSVTSWIRRIQSCTDTIKSMLDQTVPVEVELNLKKSSSKRLHISNQEASSDDQDYTK